MKFDEKYWKEKCDQLQAEVNALREAKFDVNAAYHMAVKARADMRARACKAENELENTKKEFDMLKQERDTLAENVELLSRKVEKLLEEQKVKNAKNTALLQAIRSMAQGYAMGAADNM